MSSRRQALSARLPLADALADWDERSDGRLLALPFLARELGVVGALLARPGEAEALSAALHARLANELSSSAALPARLWHLN